MSISSSHKGERGLEEATLSAILAEAMRAEAKHGGMTLRNPALSVELKLAALMEEVGEVAQLLTYDKRPANPMVKGVYYGTHDEYEKAVAGYQVAMDVWRANLVSELIQVANVAAAWAESVDHGGN